MPSAKILEQKKVVVAELADKLKSAVSAVVVNYQGINTEDDTKLRVALRQANVEYKVYKNSAMARACELAGYGDMKPMFEGMTAIAYTTDDPIAPAKIVKEYADKIESYNIKGGFIDGEIIDTAKVEALAATPAKPVLVCKIMGSMMSSLYGLAYALQAIIDKSGEAVAETAEASSEAAPAEAAAE